MGSIAIFLVNLLLCNQSADIHLSREGGKWIAKGGSWITEVCRPVKIIRFDHAILSGISNVRAPIVLTIDPPPEVVFADGFEPLPR